MESPTSTSIHVNDSEVRLREHQKLRLTRLLYLTKTLSSVPMKVRYGYTERVKGEKNAGPCLYHFEVERNATSTYHSYKIWDKNENFNVKLMKRLVAPYV